MLFTNRKTVLELRAALGEQERHAAGLERALADPGFRDLEAPHQRFHQLAILAVRTAHRGEGVAEILSRMEDESLTIMVALDSLVDHHAHVVMTKAVASGSVELF